MEVAPLFSSKVKRIFNDKRIVIITHEIDDFGNRKPVENLITIDQAKEVLKNLEQTIKEYGGTDL